MTRDELLSRYADGERNFTDANLAGANLTGADLSGADLTRANLSSADMTDANLSGAVLWLGNRRIVLP